MFFTNSLPDVPVGMKSVAIGAIHPILADQDFYVLLSEYLAAEALKGKRMRSGHTISLVCYSTKGPEQSVTEILNLLE